MGLFSFLLNGNGNGESSGPFVRRSKYEKAVFQRKAALDLAGALGDLLRTEQRNAERVNRILRQRILERDTLLKSYRIAVPALDSRLSQAENERVLAEIARMKAEDKCNQVLALHAERTRVGCLPRLEPARITARIRQIEGSLRVEEGEDEWLIYADRHLSEAEIRAIESELGVKVDRT